MIPRLLVAFTAALLVGCAAGVQEKSIGPGFNDRWKSPDIEPLVGRLESESREIYVHRRALAEAAAPPPGSVVADIGAGSGFMAVLFAEMVGSDGRVYAVDINPAMMEYVAGEARRRGIANLQTVVCSERSVGLPPESVDLMFICDTYHHFEYPKTTMRSIHEALRTGGEIVLVEFHRTPGVSRQFILDHARDREVIVGEIIESGFELIGAVGVPGLEENYVLRFSKEKSVRGSR